ncbi:MAG: beta-ketoacyl-ACP reductase [Candidatus Cloacimonetes bacterium HGW-Cloacimonetes-3]|jgi:NAD(P)-dependent dehydrogenase (short-subunit alcohol dehydrogenase family)|nr:MAG: beta-ketoacyl-ACP reductase [Candidatus Cloacimonetes bacterium HGW-Cloacimonetes-3]
MKLMLITGANGQIGSFLAHSYHSEGYLLVLLFHKRNDRLKSFENDSQCYLEAVDLTDFNAVQNAVTKASLHFGQSPEITIHCAANRSYDAKELAYSEPEVFNKVLGTNIFSAYNVLRASMPAMLDRQYGRIVMFGSEVSRTGLKKGSAYAAAKAAIVSMVQSIALETIGTNVTINAISPAPVDTNLEEDYKGDYLEFRRSYFANYLKNHPGAKLIDKAEIKQVVDLLISSALHNLSGQEIFLTGGSF